MPEFRRSGRSAASSEPRLGDALRNRGPKARVVPISIQPSPGTASSSLVCLCMNGAPALASNTVTHSEPRGLAGALCTV